MFSAEMWPRRPAKARKHRFGDPASLLAGHLDAHVVPRHHVAVYSRPPEKRQDETADRLHLRMLERDADDIACVLQRDRPTHDDAP